MRTGWAAVLFGLTIVVTSGPVRAEVVVTSPRAGQSLIGGEPVQLQARLEAVSGAAGIYLTAVVTNPGGIEEVVRLRDDGRGGDEAAGDGVWSGLYRGGNKAGAYQVVVKALVGGREMWSPRSAFSLKPAPEAPALPPPPVRRWPAAVAVMCALMVGVIAGALMRRRPAPLSESPSAPPQEMLDELAGLRSERERLTAEIEVLRPRPPEPAPAPLRDEAEAASLRAQIEEREARLAQMQREYERLDRERQVAVEREAGHALANLFDDLAGPLSQLEAARARVETGSDMEAGDLFSLLGPLRRALEQRGLAAVGAVGEQVAFDPGRHQALGDQQFQEGDAVTIRFPGFLHGERVVRKALVSGDGA